MDTCGKYLHQIAFYDLLVYFVSSAFIFIWMSILILASIFPILFSFFLNYLANAFDGIFNITKNARRWRQENVEAVIKFRTYNNILPKHNIDTTKWIDLL